MSSRKSFIFLMMLSYFAVEIIGLIIHPMWRDEIHPWSIACASSSLKQLLYLKANEGHPDLWYILVYAVKNISSNPFSMQLMHLGIALITAFLILRYAPFTRIQRGLLIFGYFFIFEYSLISRNYAIGILFIIIFLILHRHPYRYVFLKAVVLLFMMQTNVYGLILGISFFLTWIFDVTCSVEYRAEIFKHKAVLIISLILILAGIAFSISSIIPNNTAFFAGSAHFSIQQLTLRETLLSIAAIWKAWVPVPELNSQYWNTNIISPEILQAPLGFIMAVFAVTLLLKRPAVLLLFLAGLTGIIGFILMYYYGYIRHHGHLYILLIACLWLSSYYKESGKTLRPGFIESIYRWMKNNTGGIFLVILLIQLFAGMYAYVYQFINPFSPARIAAGYIKQNHLDRYTIAGDKDVSLESLAGYLNKETYFFSRRAFGTYLIYDTARHEYTPTAVLRLADMLLKKNTDTILMVMNYPLTDDSLRCFQKLAAFERSTVWDEKYYLYLYPGKKLKSN